MPIIRIPVIKGGGPTIPKYNELIDSSTLALLKHQGKDLFEETDTHFGCDDGIVSGRFGECCGGEVYSKHGVLP